MASQPVIILAFANDRKGKFLRSISEEHRGIKTALGGLEEKGLIKLVELPDVHVEDIFEAFRKYKDQVAIFHYGGHAEDLELMLSSSGEILDIESFSKYLFRQKGLQLVFMNGCATLAQKDVLEAAGIPQMILTHSKIGDQAGKAFSKKFYENLASGREIARSFEEAGAELEASKQTLYRGLSFEEEEEVDTLPWQLFQSSDNNWTLLLKAPFPWRRWAVSLAIGLSILAGTWIYRAYFQVFTVEIPFVLPEGVQASHFDLGYAHTVSFELADGRVSGALDPAGYANISGLRGIDGQVPFTFKSPIWQTSQETYVIERNPVPIKLVWHDRFRQIQGVVYDPQGNSMAGAEVRLEQGNTKTISDETGAYVLPIPEEQIAQMKHELKLYKEGFLPTSYTVNLSDTLDDYPLYLK